MLNYLHRSHPRPSSLVWINRGTDQALRPTTVALLLRTIFRPAASPSVRRLHTTSGLKVCFRTARDREEFARQFAQARARLLKKQRCELSAVFDSPAAAEDGFKSLTAAGVSGSAISILWRAGQFVQSRHDYPPGHTKLSVAAAAAGAGLAGAIFGVILLSVPGFGPVAAGGAIAAHSMGAIGAVGGALGASGGGIARMLTDIDVDDREVPYFVMKITGGSVFLSVDPAMCDVPIAQVRQILEESGGHFAEPIGAEAEK